jgi:hypothetical protein
MTVFDAEYIYTARTASETEVFLRPLTRPKSRKWDKDSCL